MYELSLTFPDMSLGTHQIPWNLNILLHNGAACIPRKKAMEIINNSSSENIDAIRIPAVCAFHEAISSMIKQGRSRALIESSLEVLWRFYSWAETNSLSMSQEDVVVNFKRWSEHQLYRSKVTKEVSEIYAYRQTSKLANLIARALKLPGSKPGGALLMQTRIRKPSSKKRVMTSSADKQNLSNTFEFGHCLRSICDALDIPTVRGRLPIRIALQNGKTLVVAGSLLNTELDLESIECKSVRKNAERARAPLAANESIFARHKRSGILNLRIESELLIFIAQTGMNLTQASSLERESYRWKSNGDDLEVFRVYKGRRSGEAIFRCYRSYKEHLQRYFKWLRDIGFTEHDKRLFPLQSRGMIRAKESKVRFYTLKDSFKKINISFLGPQEIRKTRVNWLLRRNNNLELTAEQMAHDKEVLLRDYHRPHHQLAASEIVRFHGSTDPFYKPPGPGLCVDKGRSEELLYSMPKDAPKPDCISPEGCLFCTKHRDVMTQDYCWKLSSHAKIKSLETNLYKPSERQELHPAYRVIDRINEKLETIASGSEIRAMWVSEARDLIRAGRYHPYWRGHIELMEIIA
tara:strand:+ start:1385 stop:3115 length:1731 start_codon:yes stop_codon:yes gene_type:complete